MSNTYRYDHRNNDEPRLRRHPGQMRRDLTRTGPLRRESLRELIEDETEEIPSSAMRAMDRLADRLV